jgi:surfeit locus 1 family protein
VRRKIGAALRPRLLPLHLLALAATSLALVLGFWQLEAWQAQREAAARDLTSLPAVPVHKVLDADDPFPSAGVGRPVVVEGRWLPRSTFYAAERDLDGRTGVWAVTAFADCAPMQDCATAPAVLVVRGWAVTPSAAPPAPRGRARVEGWLQPPEGSGRPDPDPSDDVLPEVRIADAIQRVDQDLYGAYVVASMAVPAGGLEGLQPVTPASLPRTESSTGLRNLFYAVEWWVFAAFAAFVWWRWTRDEMERARRR